MFLRCLYLFQSWGRLDFLASEYSLCFLQMAPLIDMVSQGGSCLVRDIDEGVKIGVEAGGNRIISSIVSNQKS